jgi:hypothetical protein
MCLYMAISRYQGFYKAGRRRAPSNLASVIMQLLHSILQNSDKSGSATRRVGYFYSLVGQVSNNLQSCFKDTVLHHTLHMFTHVSRMSDVHLCL